VSEPLHLIHMSVDARKLYAFARRSKALARENDHGYAMHALLTALFDHGAPPDARVAPKPFHVVLGAASKVDVLGYARLDRGELVRRAESFADPAAWGVCDLDALASKPMPTRFERGTRLRFEVRACPVRRIARRGPMQRERAEVDAFLARAWGVGPDVVLSREAVYREWLAEDLSKHDAARLVDCTVEQFHIAGLRRRDHGEERRAHRAERPDVRFRGALEVGDPDQFLARLARGVGRHRAFGFGMLLLNMEDEP